ncbi:MAG: sporulation protein YqfD [Bacilli bacterium]|nr:sporulation protein YqfD [Bacilli bacterium]
MNSYLLVRINGNIDRFLLKCKKYKINIINIKYESFKQIVICINENDYEKLSNIRGVYKFNLVGVKGKRKYFNIIKKYNMLFLMFIFSLIFLIFLSNVIFDIDIKSDNNELNKLILKELSNYNIDKYKLKKSNDELTKIINSIKKKYKDNIEWINIKEDGVKYIVNFVERKVNNKKESNEVYKIVSKKNGIIRNIYTYNGISLLNIGDYVSKGDILIDSDIYLNDELKNSVDAKGKVYAEVWYKVKVIYPLNYKEKKYTNNRRKIPYIKIGKNYFELFKFKKFERKNIINIKNNLSLFEIGIEEIREIRIIDKKYTNKEAYNKAIKLMNKKIKIKLNEDEKIINEKTLNFYSNGSKIIVDEFVSVYEEIGERKKVEKGEENDREYTQDGS